MSARRRRTPSISMERFGAFSARTVCCPPRAAPPERICHAERSGRSGPPLRHPLERTLLVIRLVHPTPEDIASQRPEPLEHVIHVSQVHQLDQVAVEIFRKEKRVAAGRSFRLADAFHPTRL